MAKLSWNSGPFLGHVQPKLTILVDKLKNENDPQNEDDQRNEYNAKDEDPPKIEKGRQP